MASWTAAELPDLSGRRFVVTGANSGLGAATVKELAAHGASVVMACRNADKANEVAQSLTGDVEVAVLDLANLSSIRAFAEQCGDLDVLVNNAGVMAVPKARTADGFEMQIGTNFLGHFALTGLLLPRISGRVVTLSSQAHRLGRIDLDDLNWHRRRYRRWAAYAQSKLADLMFALELHRRLTVTGSGVISVAAHPGYAATELQSHTESVLDRVMSVGNRIIAQTAEQGALPTLYAAGMPDVAGGEFYGPSGPGEMRGGPKKVSPNKAATDSATATKLWAKAESLTGVSFP
jgi:NAD(P)-dependent dehydrogenase (short-subunit alcohol dehydrogenase family)